MRRRERIAALRKQLYRFLTGADQIWLSGIHETSQVSGLVQEIAKEIDAMYHKPKDAA